MRALVLGGGSMKGAFQVGAIKAVIESGFEPEMIYGISVGALNSTFLINETGKQQLEDGVINWKQVGRKLLEFWIENIRQPQDIVILRSKMLLGMNTIRSKFDGILDPTPLQEMIRGHIKTEYLEASPIKCKVGAVDIQSGNLEYRNKSNPQFLDFVNASSSIPMLMPAVSIDGKLYMDGSIREVAPIHQAIADGATEIMLIACHAPRLYKPENLNAQNLITLVDRVRDITVNQIVNCSIQWAESYVEGAIMKGKSMSLDVIRPETPLILDLQRFTSGDISRLLVEGYRVGLKVLEQKEAGLAL